MYRFGATLCGLGIEMRRLQAVVLCGGQGKRLRSHLGDGPKSLAPIAGRPFLTLLFAQLMKAGITEVILCTGHGSAAIEAAYSDGSHHAISISYSIEHQPLGTAGALKHAEIAIRSNPFLLLNGDSLVELDIPTFLKAHAESGALATMALAHVENSGRYGTVKLNPNRAVTAFSEKNPENGSDTPPTGGLINAGVYALDRKVLWRIPLIQQEISFEREILPSLVGHGLFGYSTDGFFIDIGVPEDYDRAQTEIPRRMARARSHSC
jgi:NDP-sugar pyrophosphorylase family protein